MENKFFLCIVSMLARMLGMTSEEVINWMISMINSMFPTVEHISQMLKAWGIECYNYLDRPRKEVYIGDASSSGETYKVKWCPGITKILQHTLTGLPPIEELIIPETVTEIETGAFSDLKVSRISFPSKLKSIPAFVCSSCYALKQVEIPDTVETIGYGAFLYCHNLSEIRIPGSVMAIEENAFKGCDALPDDVKEHIRFIGGSEALGEQKKPDVHKEESKVHTHCLDYAKALKEEETKYKDSGNE
jgi:hypothetical protein